MRLRDYATTLATYNAWMNERLYACAAQLSDEERKRDRGAFFGSIHATLNHILLGDQAWMQRLSGKPLTMQSAGDELYSDFDALRTARRAMDREIGCWAASIEESFADAPYTFDSVVYRRTRTVPGWVVVAHFFNHQTHHRGQVTTLLSQLGVDPGVTDLPWMPAFDEPADQPLANFP